MRLVNWNIQWGRGVDGKVDLARIVDEARRLADFDVLSLQEVSRGFDGGEAGGGLPGNPSADQFEELAGLLPGYSVIAAIGADLPAIGGYGPRRQFGNAIVTRLPVGPVFRHGLPWPADPDQMSMPRVVLEAVLYTDVGPVRLLSTHLEYYSARQRLAQAEALRTIHAEACDHAVRLSLHGKVNGPFAPTERPAAAIICGDFNSAVDADAYKRVVAPMPQGVPDLLDAWLVANPQAPRAPTVGVHDAEQWPDGPFACDFILLTPDLAKRVVRCEADQQSAASDHQALVLELN
jgi:endonuclease/exonuclease/phosphatase family metal-dependent hydrolase